jgi:hypothetical protein
MVRRSIARLRIGFARLAELVDARDLKSLVLRDVPVRVRERAPFCKFTDVSGLNG